MQGKVRQWFPDRFYGFIEIEGGLDYFFHGSEVSGDGEVRRGSRVEFLIDDDPRGGEKLVATGVQVL